MKKNVLFIAFIMISIFYLNCTAAKPQYQELIGKRVKSMKELPILQGFSSFGTTLASEYKTLREPYYRLFDFRNDSIGLLLLVKYESDSTGNIRHISDIVEVKKLNKSNYIGYGGHCRTNGKRDSEVIVFFKIEDEKTKFFQTIYKAWRIDIQNGKINEISTDGIDFLNSEYKPDF
jgi:hypothetical protein